MMTTTEYPHVEVDDQGRAFIKGTRFKVVQIVKDRVYYGWSAEEIQRQHEMLTLPQVYTALAYYYDHKQELDAVMAEQDRNVETIRASMPEPPAVERLRKLMRQKEQEVR
jgi:uncharacterized protein (DUF433 family)